MSIQFLPIAFVRKLRMRGKKFSPICPAQNIYITSVCKLRMVAQQVHQTERIHKFRHFLQFIRELRLVTQQVHPGFCIQILIHLPPIAFVRKLRMNTQQIHPIITAKHFPLALVRKLRILFKQLRQCSTIQHFPFALVRKLRLSTQQIHPDVCIQFLVHFPPVAFIRKLRTLFKQICPVTPVQQFPFAFIRIAGMLNQFLHPIGTIITVKFACHNPILRL